MQESVEYHVGELDITHHELTQPEAPRHEMVGEETARAQLP